MATVAFDSDLVAPETDETARGRVKEIKRFILAGDATFTVQNEKTGNRFTYRVRKAQDGGCWFVGVLTGSDNYSDYSYMGIIKGVEFFGTRKSRVSRTAPSYVAFDWVWRNVGRLPACVQVWHEGACCRCGRKLTTPESVEKGIGPVCEGKGW
jgi:hypothetical protein